ncbi:MAG: hypothetical protein M3O50_10340, partial [Myxococcota bacterium]|nr:hypothetical protein [Myxococcota bacterium]
MSLPGRPSQAFLAAATVTAAVFGTPLVAKAQEPADSVPLVFGADEVHLDARSKAIDASGHVHVDELPFHLTSDALRLRRVAIGAELEGEGKLSFCRCLGTPLAVRFRSATVAPPHDVIMHSPVLEVFGLPVAWAPVLWLRSPGRTGLLPPELAWRGADGLFAGAGLHLPWQEGDVDRGFDLRAGGYSAGGAAVEVTMRTGASVTRVAWDHLRGDGLTLGAHGTASAADSRGPSE